MQVPPVLARIIEWHRGCVTLRESESHGIPVVLPNQTRTRIPPHRTAQRPPTPGGQPHLLGLCALLLVQTGLHVDDRAAHVVLAMHVRFPHNPKWGGRTWAVYSEEGHGVVATLRYQALLKLALLGHCGLEWMVYMTYVP